MAYTINKTDGTELVILEDSTVDTSTSITLVGRNYIGYGEAQNENFLFLLENFAHITPPARAIVGQLWFDKTTNTVKVYDSDNKWVEVGSAALSETPPPTPPQGAFWLRTNTNTLFVWTGSEWAIVGPEAALGFGTTRATSTTIRASDSTPQPVILVKVDNAVVAIIARTPFTILAADAIPGFSDLDAGINLNTATYIQGTLHGTADRALSLNTARNINGVGFDGTSDITIKASTTNKLVRGSYLTGNDFDGSSAQTWNVDATPNATIGKVVARDGAGNFAANEITSDLIGNVTGNVNASTGTSSFDVVTANSFIGATLSGNANTATRLATPRRINGVNFDGQSDITVTAAAGTLTGNSLANNVLLSSLQSVGTLTNLTVAGTIVLNSNLTLSAVTDAEISANRELKLESTDSSGSAQIKILSPDVSVLAGTGTKGALSPQADGGVDLGKSNLKWDSAYANIFVGDLQGNADTATLSTTTTNLAGGAKGAIPYQTASGTTTLLPAGTDTQVLKMNASGLPYWGSGGFATPLEIGDYLTGIGFDGITPTRWSVDATPNNTALKVVARDSSGNFSAGTITASLVGNVNGNTVGTHTGNVVGNVTGNVTGDVSGTSSYATYSTTQSTGTSNTTIATTAFVQQEIQNSRPRTLTISDGSINLSSPNSQYRDLINAYLPASSVANGTEFYLIINMLNTSTTSSFSAGRWINAYQWGTASISSSTVLTSSSIGYKLRYTASSGVWNYSSWSFV